MKKFLSSILLLVVLCVPSWAALSDNLISYWALDEASGSRADKVVASANTLTDNNTVTQAVGRVYANSAQFVKLNSEYLSISDNASVSTTSTAFTIILFVLLDDIAGGSALYGRDAGGTDRELGISYQGGSGFRFRTWTGASGAGFNELIATTAGVATINTWYMVACTSDLTTKKISVNAGTQDSVASANAGWNSAAALEIGRENGGYGNMRLGPVMFWKRALSAAEITQVYNGGIGLTYEGILGTGIIPHPLTSGGDSTGTVSGTVFTTSSVTIHANRLAILSYQYARDAGQAGVASVTSTGATWHTLGTSVNYHTTGTPTRTLKVFYTMVGSDQTSAITITHTAGPQDGAAWSLVEFEGVQTGGTDGSLAIGTPATMVGGSGSTQVTCTVGSFSDTVNNVAYGAFGRSNNAGITPGSGFIEIDNPSYATPSNELETEYRTGQDTTIDATWAGGTDCACVGVEIKKVGTGLNPALLSALIDED